MGCLFPRRRFRRASGGDEKEGRQGPEKEAHGVYLPRKKVPTHCKGCDLAVRHRAFEHPEAAVRMDVADPSVPHHGLCVLDGPGDLFGGLDVVHLDIDDPEADPDPLVDILDGLEIFGRSMGEFEDEMVGVQGIEELKER